MRLFAEPILTTTFGAFLSFLEDLRRTLTLPLPLTVLVALVPAMRTDPLIVALVVAGGIAAIVQTIDLPSAARSQVTRTLGVSPFSPLSPLSPFAPAGPAGPVAPLAPLAPTGPPGPPAPPAPL